MARVRGQPKRGRHIVLEDGQFETLVALAELNDFGSVTLSSMVRKAVDEYIARLLEKDESLKEKLEAQKNRPRLVSIRGGKGGSNTQGGP